MDYLLTFDEQGGEFPLLEMFCTFALSVGAAVSQILPFSHSQKIFCVRNNN
jgi:hypothetical protein